MEPKQTKQAPITEISLPSHHSAVSGCKPGEMVTIHARRAPEMENEVSPSDRPKGQRPPPLTTRFHVMTIDKKMGMKMDRPKGDGMAYLKEMQHKEASKGRK